MAPLKRKALFSEDTYVMARVKTLAWMLVRCIGVWVVSVQLRVERLPLPVEDMHGKGSGKGTQNS